MELVICFPQKMGEQEIKAVNNILAAYGFSNVVSKEGGKENHYQTEGQGFTPGDLTGKLYEVGIVIIEAN